jgi:hypothetical protein
VLDPRKALGWLGRDFGEDWVVPRAQVRCLVARSIGASKLLTAYGPDGQVLGERLFASAGEADAVMRRLSEENLAEEWREIPDDVASARLYLDQDAAGRGREGGAS